MNDAMWAGTVTITGHGEDELEAYLARPLGNAPRGGVVVIHHMPGYDAGTKEFVRTFAAHGYAAICLSSSPSPPRRPAWRPPQPPPGVQARARRDGEGA